MRHVLCALVVGTLVAFGLAAEARAQTDSIEDAALALDENWTCGREATLPPPLRKALANGDLFLVRGPQPGDMIALAKLPGVSHGTLLLRRDGAAWTAFYLAQGSEVSAVRARERTAAVQIISFWVRESGGALHAARYDWRSRMIACNDLAMPSDLNQPAFNGEYATFTTLDIDASGQGRLISKAQLDRENDKAARFYVYDTGDDGRTWSQPQRVTQAPPAKSWLPPAATTRVSRAVRAEIAKTAQR